MRVMVEESNHDFSFYKKKFDDLEIKINSITIEPSQTTLNLGFSMQKIRDGLAIYQNQSEQRILDELNPYFTTLEIYIKKMGK